MYGPRWVQIAQCRVSAVLSRKKENLFVAPPMSLSTPSTPSVASNGSVSPPGTHAPSTPPNLHQNSTDPDAPWLVQKFGGTSVGKFAAKIAEDVVSYAIQCILFGEGT